MANLNKWIGIGNLTADPEVKYITDGTAVANFTIACNEHWTKDGEKKERTEFVRVVAWKRLAEICGEYLSKGKPVYIEGRMQTRSWEDKEGTKRYTTEIIANDVQFLGSKGDSYSDNAAPLKKAANEIFSKGDEDIPF